ncbi:putative bifunctional diguanylate cyclase/phosphodiesterase [Phytohabitans suffuscus]|uniref:Bifunctional diguanylate cyclase/phosphodiesterase n=1 Tax=Phytohabitans suffuscus TaxID=624315 RepID=A0A6F8YKR6_9ACTN|nr:bifunctional diguanylate cyclase/phosphodiesterase [Phytohabitans suffuscus]BCB86702.1 bifunctional diguanylate cyclase/phosphodiesterase [Phytohabitans suffuscus]
MTSRQAGRRRSAENAWLITGPLGILAVVVTTGLALVDDSVSAGDLGIAALLLAIAVGTEVAILPFLVRRHGVIVAINEIPLVLALFYLSPPIVVLVFFIGNVITQSRRRLPPVKLWFNIAKTTAAAALAGAVLLAFPPMHGVGPATWGILFAAVATYTLVTFIAVVGVFALVQGMAAAREVLRAGPRMLVLTVGVNVAVGLIILIVLRVTPWAGLLMLGLAVALAMVYRSYAQFLSQHRTLTQLYDLTRAIGGGGGEGGLADDLLFRVRTLMQAEFATLWLPAQGRHPEVLLSARVDDSGLLDIAPTPPLARAKAQETGSTVAVGTRFEPGEALRRAARESSVKDVIVTPLRSGQAVIGTLEVVNRLGETAHFTPDDVRVLETIAAHAGVAVENSRLVDRLRYDAYHDGLTALANRRRITEALEESVVVRAPGEVVAVLLFDVDRLRDVNESLGHAAGDKLLAEVARRLRAFAPPAALVGRVGGDEFVVTLRSESIDAAGQLAVDLREQIRDPIMFGTLTLDVDTAVGVVVHPDHGTDPATLLQRADVAATVAKSVPGGVQLFSAGLESRSVRRLELAGDLRRALDNDELEVYFQPKVTLTDRRLVGVECLARWEHPAHGAVSPEDFVAVAEHTGQLGRLTEAVLKEGLRRCREWADADRPLAVAVNLSPRTLVDPGFPGRVEALLREYGVSPGQVTFEIKEDGVTGPTDRPLPTLRRLRDLGVRLSVDDFGTGYSSLSYLRRLPVHEVKIDRTFVQGMATDAGDLAIVRAVVALSLQFGLTVVAEGVESELTLDLLKEMGCEIGQGFLFSRPLPYERLEAWFGARTESEPTPLGEVRRLRAVT